MTNNGTRNSGTRNNATKNHGTGDNRIRNGDTDESDPAPRGSRDPWVGTADVDIAVVGAGVAGLTAAVVAARAGASVAVVDALGRVGGRARTDDLDGLLLNQGPHALYLRGAALREWREIGIDPAGATPPLGGVGRRDGVLSPLPLGASTVFTTSLLTPRGRLVWVRFQASLSRLVARAARDGHLDHSSVATWLSRVAPRVDVRELLEAVVRLATYAADTETMSAGAAVRQLQMALGGVRYLDGGWESTARALADAATAAGATIETDRRVQRLDRGAEGWRLQTERGPLAARQVVLAGLSPESVERLCELPDASLRRRVGATVRAACLDLELAEPPSASFALDLDRRLYASVHAPLARLAPEDSTLLSLAHYRSPADGDGGARCDDVLEAFARELGAGAPVRRRYLHSMIVAHGVPLAVEGGFAGRPAVDDLTGVADGVWLAGDWVGAEGFLADAAVASAVVAARRAAAAVVTTPRVPA